MGIFDKIFKVDESKIRDLNLTKEEAFFGILVGATSADGILVREEQIAVISALNQTKMFNHLTEPQFRQMIHKTNLTIRNNGIGTIFSAAARVLPNELKESAFALAVDVILADGRVDPKEKEFLDNMQRVLGINEGLAQKIAEVMVIKNRI